MENLVNFISDKLYEDIQCNIIQKSFQVLMDALARTMEGNIPEKDKEWTLTRLNKTIDLMRQLFINQNTGSEGSFIQPDIIKKVKLQVANSKTAIGQIFCFNRNKALDAEKEKESENEKKDEIKGNEPSRVEFIKEIPNAIEIPRYLFDIPLELTSNPNDYHYFTVNIMKEYNITESSYYLTYAEKNKFSKRELIAVYKGKTLLSNDQLPESIRNKYNFM